MRAQGSRKLERKVDARDAQKHDWRKVCSHSRKVCGPPAQLISTVVCGGCVIREKQEEETLKSVHGLAKAFYMGS